MKDRWKIVIGTFVILGIIGLISFLIGISFSSIPYTSYGIKYNILFHTINYDQSIRESGNYLVGPTQGFILFPTNIFKQQFQLTILTKDKSIVEVQALTLHQLNRQYLLNLLFDYDGKYEQIILAVVEQNYRKVLEEKKLSELVTNRENIIKQLTIRVVEAVKVYPWVDTKLVTLGKIIKGVTEPIIVPAQTTTGQLWAKLLSESVTSQKIRNFYDSGAQKMLRQLEEIQVQLFKNCTTQISNNSDIQESNILRSLYIFSQTQFLAQNNQIKYKIN